MCGLTPHSNKKKSASRPGKKFLWKNLQTLIFNRNSRGILALQYSSTFPMSHHSYTLRPKTQLILLFLGQTNKYVKIEMTLLVPIYQSYLTLIDCYMDMHKPTVVTMAKIISAFVSWSPQLVCVPQTSYAFYKSRVRGSFVKQWQNLWGKLVWCMRAYVFS